MRHVQLMLEFGCSEHEARLFNDLVEYLLSRKTNPDALPSPELDAAFNGKAIETIATSTKGIDDFGIAGFYDPDAGTLRIHDIAGTPDLAALPLILIQLYPGKLPLAYAVKDKRDGMQPIWTIITAERIIITEDQTEALTALSKRKPTVDETGRRTRH